jgi:hypothetical protein
MHWRIPAVIGGLGGLGSLLLPYAFVSSRVGDVGDVGPAQGHYTLFELATLLAETGNDPTAVYALAAVIVFASAVTLLGAVTFHHLAAAGGLVQAGAAALYWYGLQLEGSHQFLMGLGRVDATFAVGFLMLVGSAAVSLLAAAMGAVGERDAAASAASGTDRRRSS